MGVSRQIIEKQPQCQGKPEKVFPAAMDEVDACNLLTERAVSAGCMEAVQDFEMRTVLTQFSQLCDEHIDLFNDSL